MAVNVIAFTIKFAASIYLMWSHIWESSPFLKNLGSKDSDDCNKKAAYNNIESTTHK